MIARTDRLVGFTTETRDPRPWAELVESYRSAGISNVPEHGAWETEPDDAHWIDSVTGYPCTLWRNHIGAWCGYVGVPRGHPAHGLDYSQAEERWDVFVHGGLTYSGMMMAEGDWWFGFDCGHAFDMSPGMPCFDFPERGSEWMDVYRHLDYVIQQALILADELAAISVPTDPSGSVPERDPD